MSRLAALLVALTLTLGGCERRPGPARESATLTRAELDAAHDRLARARDDLRARPFAARLVAILVEPFGSQRNANVQAFFNVEAAALWACAAGAPVPAAVDVVVAYDAGAIVDLAAFGADRVRLPDVEACLRARFAGSPLADPVAPGRMLFIPAALVPAPAALVPATTPPASR